MSKNYQDFLLNQSTKYSKGFQQLNQCSQADEIIENILLYVGFQYYCDIKLINRKMYEICASKRFLDKFFDLAFIRLQSCHVKHQESIHMEFDMRAKNSSNNLVHMKYLLSPTILLYKLLPLPTNMNTSTNSSNSKLISFNEYKSIFAFSEPLQLPQIDKFSYIGNHPFPDILASTLVSPFTVKRVFGYDDNRCCHLSLSSICYFEISCKTYSESSNRGVDETENMTFAIGVCASTGRVQSSLESMIYRSDGKFFKDGQLQHDARLPSFSTEDVIGCGIVYPPLEERGRIFFTRNDELIFSASILRMNSLSLAWLPIAYCSNETILDVNFGFDNQFRFDLNNYEISILKRRGKEDGQKWYADVICNLSRMKKLSLHSLLRENAHFYMSSRTSDDSSMSNSSQIINRLKRRKQSESIHSFDTLWSANSNSPQWVDPGSNGVIVPQFVSFYQSSVPPRRNDSSTSLETLKHKKRCDTQYSDSSESHFMELSTLDGPTRFENDSTWHREPNPREMSNLDDDNISIATSLLVEVASVDEDGIYLSYGGSHDDYAVYETDSLRLISSSPPVLSISYPPAYNSPNLLASCTSAATSLTTTVIEDCQVLPSSVSSSVSGYSLRDEVPYNRAESVDEWSLYGYDGGSERCKRDEESDCGDDLATVGEMDVEEQYRDYSDKLLSTSIVHKKATYSNSLQLRDYSSVVSSLSNGDRCGVRSPSESCYPPSISSVGSIGAPIPHPSLNLNEHDTNDLYSKNNRKQSKYNHRRYHNYQIRKREKRKNSNDEGM